MCRKSIFVSFRNGRITVKPQKPGYICREEIPRWVWWLHIILVVVGGTSCGMEEMAQSEKLQANPACGAERGEVGFCKLVLDLFDWRARCDLWSAGMNRQQLARRNKQRPLASDPCFAHGIALLAYLARPTPLALFSYLTKEGRLNRKEKIERQRLTDNFHLVLLVWFSAVSFDK